MATRKNRVAGAPPASVEYTGDKKEIDVIVTYVEYNSEHFKERVDKVQDEFEVQLSSLDRIQWYDIRGLHDIDLINQIGNKFGMHPLAVENAVDVHQRPIYLEYDNGHFISLKFLRISSKGIVERQTIGIYFGAAYVLTFQEDEDDLFSKIRNRISKKGSRVRSRGSDYLAYSLIDFIVDYYFDVIDQLEERIERIEEKISDNPEESDKVQIYDLKKNVLKVRKSIQPLRETINQFSRSDSSLIKESTVNFIRDVYDHTIQITESVDSLREILAGLHDLYISELSLKMNKIMQFLTIVTAVFVPISFLTGLYGMNFKNIPELEQQNGYFVLLGVIIISVTGMLWYFKRKEWL